MMEDDGTVAIVRGLPGAALTVTLVDSGRQYTLLPESFTHPSTKKQNQACHTTGSQCVNTVSRRESGVQATDGRYASTYKLMHCHCTPTSPAQVVTEFPPQKSDLCPGHDNFEVGGTGSGEGVYQPTRCNSFRGGMIWPDRGSVFSPRPSLQQDSFATSLRKYPNSAHERSSEIVERLINFTQAKNSSKPNQKGNVSPTRNVSEVSDQTFCPTSSSRSVRCNRYQPEVCVAPRRFEESPTREKPRNTPPEQDTMESWRRPTFSKTNDVRYIKNMSKIVRDGIRSLSAQGNNIQPERLSPREKCESASNHRATHRSTNTVNMEIQAAVQMISREVITLPRIVPTQRTIAVPLTPTPSNVVEQDVSENYHKNNMLYEPDLSSQFVTNLVPIDIMVQTAISNTVVIKQNKNKRRLRRRSKSEEEIKRSTNLKAIRNIHNAGCSRTKSIHKTHKYNRSLKALLKLVKNFEIYSNSDEEKNVSRHARICYAQVTKKKPMDENKLVEILENWIDLIPLKYHNFHEKQIAKEYLFYNLYEFIKKSIFFVHPEEETHILKKNIVNRLEFFPLYIKGNKKNMLHNLADILISRLSYNGHENSDEGQYVKRDEYQTACSSMYKTLIVPTEHEVRKFVSKQMKSIRNTLALVLENEQNMRIEEDLIDIIMTSMEEIRSGCDSHIKHDIAELLFHNGLPEQRAFCYAFILVRRFKSTYLNTSFTSKVRSESFIVLPSLKNSNNRSTSNNSEITKNRTINEEFEANLEHYTNNLCKQIDEWLSTLYIHMPQAKDKGLKNVIINDLAGDIIDRYKYLELNPDSKVSEEIELENLKYQIFKWVNKLIGEESLEPMEHAQDLMIRIKHVPRPALLKSDVKKFSKITQRRELSENELPGSRNDTFVSIPEYIEQKESNINNYQEATNSNATESLWNVEEEYQQFIRDWVQKIPIEDIAEAEEARLKIYHNLWKIITQLNCNPNTYYNRFLYEDILDDAINDMFDCLPQSELLKAKRHPLRAEFIVKTIETNQRIIENNETSYKNNLMKYIIASLHQKGLNEYKNDDPVKLHEDLQIMKIIEEFLLSIRFRDDDKLKSEIYKKKLLKEIEDFVSDLKKNHDKELKDVDVSTYKADIINILQKVPLPSDDTIKQEADDVMLGLEIEQWYNDLPVISNNDYIEQYKRRRQRDILAKKIKNIDENNNTSSSDTMLRNEVSRFLGQAPLKHGETLNINHMVDELVNRIKEKSKQKQDQSSKKVIIQAPSDYDDFSRNIPFHSSIAYKDNLPLQETLNESFAKDKSNQQWVSLQEVAMEPTRKEHIKLQAVHPPYSSSQPRNVLDNNQAIDQKMNGQKIETPLASIFSQPTPSGIKTDRGILGISQLPGPSGYTPDISEAIVSNPTDYRSSAIRREEESQFEADELASNTKSASKKVSIDKSYYNQIQKEVESLGSDKISRGVNTSIEFDGREPIFTSTPLETVSPTIPLAPSKRRAKLAPERKETVTRRLSFEDTDEDDIPCRCIEKYWKNQLQKKRLNCFERFPPYMPIFFPFPYPPFPLNE